MKILLFGHSGFAGRNIADFLLQEGISHYGVSRSTGVDLRVQQEVVNLLEIYKPDYIVNCAAHVGSLNYVSKFAGDVINNNVQMISALYEALRKVGKNITVINPIANCAFPGDANLYQESQWLLGEVHDSVASYGNSRRLMYAYSTAYRKQHNIKTINFFVPNMYGEYDSTDPNKAHALNALISKFVKSEMNGTWEVDIWGTGSPIREWLYAKDFAKVIVKVLKDSNLQDMLTQPVSIAQNNGISMKELADIINVNFSNKMNLKYLTDMQDGAPKKVMANKKFREHFGTFEFTDFNVGIKNTIKYYKSQYPY